jgi:hypothetical protein
MAVQLDIINRALRRIGEKPITSIADDSKAALAAVAHYTATVREILRLIEWTCAVMRSQLTYPDADHESASTSDPADAWTTPELKAANVGDLWDQTDTGYRMEYQETSEEVYGWVNINLTDFEYEYDVPADCLRVLELFQGGERQDYQIEGVVIYTDADEPVIRYIGNITESAFDDMLAAAIELRLASKLAYELTNDDAKSQRLFQEAAAIIADARRETLAEARPGDPDGEPLWTTYV